MVDYLVEINEYISIYSRSVTAFEFSSTCSDSKRLLWFNTNYVLSISAASVARYVFILNAPIRIKTHGVSKTDTVDARAVWTPAGHPVSAICTQV